MCHNPYAGHPDRIDHLRADLFLGMIDGSYIGRDDDAIIAMLLATARTDDDGAAGPDSRPGGHGPGERSEGDCSDQRHAQEGSDGDGPDECSGHVENGARGGRRSGCLEVRVRLSTLLGLDDCPGELAGWGPVHAELTRDLVRAHAGGQWRFALTDDGGQLLHAGITRRRPTGWARTRSAGVVELQAPAAVLDLLADEQLGEWTGVVADLRHHATDQASHGAARFADDAGRRLPGAVLRRYVKIRDRCCRFPTCRAPAHSTDTDHSVDHAHGGATVDVNLGECCRHDHRLKHEGGWRLTQPEPGHFVWISRLGRVYSVGPQQIMEPLPGPVPRNDNVPPFGHPPDDDWDDTIIWDDQAGFQPEPQPNPGSGPEPDPAGDVPPF